MPSAPLPDRRLDRRRFLVLGGVTASLTAAAVACAKEDQAIPVSGEVAQPATLTQPPVTDAVYLRTSSSVVYNAIESYGTLLETNALSSEDADLVTFIVDQHQEQADRLGAATVAVGGQAFEKPNPSVDGAHRDPGAAGHQRRRHGPPRHPALRQRVRDADQRLAPGLLADGRGR